MLTLVKLGGSLITDKHVEASFRQDVVERLAQEVRSTIDADPELQIIIGHGSGSFGHFAAKRYGTMTGVRSSEDWRGFAHVATVAAALNYQVARIFDEASIPVWPMQPSASSLSQDGVIVEMALEPVRHALEHRLVPLVYGDVSLDEVRGGTIISTEAIFAYLTKKMNIHRILLLGEVEGVFDSESRLISVITPSTFSSITSALGGSNAVDVTGGMLAKVQGMLDLIVENPELTIRIMGGTVPGMLTNTLLQQTQPGTLILADP